MTNNQPPEWVTTYAQDCRQLLGIGDEWHITIQMSDKPNGSEEAGGSVDIDAQYLNAVMELRHDCFTEEDDQAHQIILHEMMHIGLASFRMVVDQLFLRMPDDMQTLGRIMVDQAEEQYIQRTSRAVLRMLKPTE